ncbi:hypothetical protein LVJ94_27845 [Pendulispora rubella]|uniref:Transmembrane protein n=1 Tax=Pendulispora rubella TaxID=2741070 RepID=A0ABZ2KQE9_9BACT
MNRVSTRRSALLAVLCGLMALAFCWVPVGSSFAAWATLSVASATAPMQQVAAVDSEHDERDSEGGSASLAFPPEEEEEHRHDEPVAKFERVIDTSQHGKDLKGWERVAIERPVSDVDVECPRPPPRA